VRRPRPPRAVMVTIVAITATAGTIGFTIAPLYRLQTVGLDPLQLVLVGSAMEATVFLAEVPTGIVADAVSRRLSVIVGHGGIGFAFLLEAAWPTFTGVVTAQVLWGLAYTFTSGATTAWLAGELGEPDGPALSSLFLRLSRLASIAALAAVPCAWLLAGWSLRTPLAVAGALELVLTVWLVAAMGEERFRPTPRSQRSTWRHLVEIGRDGLEAMWSCRVLAWFALFAVVVGGASEAYDRLYEAQLLGPVGIPDWFGWSPLVWFGLLTTASAALGIVVPPLVERARPAATARRHTRWLLWLTAVQIAGLLLFGLTGAFVVAAVASLAVERSRSVRDTLLASYLVPLTPPSTRATVLSAFGQADAIGQVAIGPAFGLIGRVVGLPAALVASALATAPGLPIIAAASRARVGADQPVGTAPA
jgi:DHA3 family tetracycline resistance protein-like MFS transporter